MMETLLDSRTTGLVMSSEFVRKIKFKLKKIERPIYVRNVNGTFNKERLIEYKYIVHVYFRVIKAAPDKKSNEYDGLL